MSTQTQTRPNDLEAVSNGFYNNLGNGVLAAEKFATIMHAVVDTRDTTIFSRDLTRVINNKKDAPAASAMRRVFGAVFPGAKISKKGKNFSVQIKGIKADTDAIARMDQAVADKVSIRGTFAKIVVGDREAPKRDKAAVMTSDIRAAKKAGISKAEFLKLAEAMWNDVKVD